MNEELSKPSTLSASNLDTAHFPEQSPLLSQEDGEVIIREIKSPITTEEALYKSIVVIVALLYRGPAIVHHNHILVGSFLILIGVLLVVFDRYFDVNKPRTKTLTEEVFLIDRGWRWNKEMARLFGWTAIILGIVLIQSHLLS